MPPAYGAPRDDAGPRPVRPTPRQVAAALTGSRRDAGRVLLEGVHPIKHALRFGARLELVATPDPAGLRALVAELAPDVADAVDALSVPLEPSAWRAVAPRALPSPALGLARRPAATSAEVLTAPGRVVVLEEPRHLGNLGAAIRTAAAAGAGGLLVVGGADPWHPTAVRAAAGLQFALAVGTAGRLPATDRPVVALDPGGPPLHAGDLPHDAVVLVGTERAGLSAELRARAATTRSLPMRPGVSSLNLAVAVGAALYLGGTRPP